MPSRQTVDYGGLQLKVEPGYPFRRWLRNPFYLESHNPSFRVRVNRVRERPDQDALRAASGYRVADVEDDALPIEIRTADDTGRRFEVLLIPTIDVGDTAFLHIPQIMSSTGKVDILLKRWIPSKGANDHELPPQLLYSYLVHSEASLWKFILVPLSVAGAGWIIRGLVDSLF